MVSDIQKLESPLDGLSGEQAKIDAINAEALSLQDSDPERALALATDTYQRSQTSGAGEQIYVKGVVDSLCVLAWYQFEHTTNYGAALQYCAEALVRAKSIDYDLGQIRANYQSGKIHQRIGNYPHALNSHLSALKIARAYGELYFEAQTLRGISSVYYDTKDHEKALEYSEKALHVFAELKDDYHYALMLNNISMSNTNLQNYKAALEFGFLSLGVFIKIDSWSGRAVVEDTIAHAYAGLGDFDQAVEYVLKNLELLRQHGPKSHQAQALQNVGKIYLQSEQPQAALAYLLEGLEMGQAIGSKARIYECHQLLAQVYEQQGDVEQSLWHLKQYVAVYEEVVNRQSMEKLTLLETAHRTEQAQVEAEKQRELSEQNRRYHERLAQMRDQLISSASHDLKNPLAAILNYVYLLRLSLAPIDETNDKYLARIEAQVDQMRDLISDLLELARLETGRALDWEDVLLGQFLDPILLDHAAQAKTKNVRLETSSYPSDLLVSIDTRQMRRVLNNLISNAIKYTPSGGQVTIAIVKEPESLTIAVTDTGIGIPRHDLPHIFEQFYRVESEAHAKIDGTGLGLAIVKSIVEQHGGAVGVRSKEGEGSTFFFSVPLSPNGADHVAV